MIDKKIKISVQVEGEKFSITCHHIFGGRFRVKMGKSWSEKVGLLTVTEIFDLSRKWVVSAI